MHIHSRVLVVDAGGPDALMRRQLLGTAGHETSQASSTDDALVELQRFGADVVLLDLDVTGLQGLTSLAANSEGAQVVLVTGRDGLDQAREGLRLGAFDVVEREAGVDALLFAVERAAREGVMRRELALLRARVGEAAREALIGKSAAMDRVRELVGRAAATRMTLLVTGEPGTGKDIVARLVHDLSDRAARPYVSVRCGGVPAEALEAELFGTVAPDGGAVRRGLFEEARGGTLVLEEVTEIPATLRARLAHVLAERAVRRVGNGADVVPVDVRLVLMAREAVDSSPSFSSDALLGRSHVLPIALPPLRDRRSDIPQLVQHFRARLGRETGQELPPLAADVVLPLLGQQWPGNVRELEHWVERAAYAPAGERVTGGAGVRTPPASELAALDEAHYTLEELERRYILHVLDQEEGHQSRAADRLGIDRRTLYRKLKGYRVDHVVMHRAG